VRARVGACACAAYTAHGAGPYRVSCIGEWE